MGCSAKPALVLSFLALAPVLVAQTPRIPRGIYAVVNTEDLINQLQPSITTVQLDAYFNSLYQDLLSNPAVSGLVLQVHWDRLNPNRPAVASPYAWNLVDDAFNQVAAWDAQNPAQAPKTIQLIATPGFNSPPWILAQIPSCDGPLPGGVYGVPPGIACVPVITGQSVPVRPAQPVSVKNDLAVAHGQLADQLLRPPESRAIHVYEAEISLLHVQHGYVGRSSRRKIT